MQTWDSLKRLLDPAQSLEQQRFSLGDRGAQPIAERNPTRLGEVRQSSANLITHIDSLLAVQGKEPEEVKKVGDLTTSLDENLKRLKALFRLPTNKDVIIREFEIATQPPTKAAVAFLEGISDSKSINDFVLQPLMLLSHLDHHVGNGGEHKPEPFSVQMMLARLLPGHQIAEQPTLDKIAEAILAGDTLVFCDGAAVAVSVETKAPPVRSVGEPQNEPVIWGPQDAFNEAWRVNVALVRRRLKDPRLITEILKAGQVSRNYIGMLYIDGIASPKLVEEVRRRVESIQVDVVTASAILEQYIEDHPGSFLPSLLTTERPDRTAAYLSEGHVALFVDNSPYALIAPVTFWSLMQTSEDYYLRFPFGSILRLLRLGALVTAVVMPAFWLSIINYHPEMLPTEFLLFIASAREAVPMPAILEYVLMDVAFELIRETSVRIPGLIGPTMGIVASLVLGQAAVEAKIVSPITIIIVALTGLASFAIPNYIASFGLRWLRYVLLAAAVALGFYGLAITAFLLVLFTASMRSFGVPYLSPVAPVRSKISDVVNRPRLYEMEERPAYLRPGDKRRQKGLARAWDPVSRQAWERIHHGRKPDESDGGGSK